MATIGSLIFKIGTDTAEILEGVKKTNAALDTMPQALSRVQARASAWGSFVGNVMADVASKVAQLAVQGIGDLVERSERISSVGTSFDRLTTSAGLMGEELLKLSRGATKGLVSDFDLMLAANKAMVLGLPVTADSFATLTQSAIVLGRAMGVGPVQSINDLVEGLGKGSPEVLNNLGIIVKAEDAYKRYGAEIKKVPDALSAAEKQTAVYNAAMEAASLKVEALGGLQSRSIDILTRLKVAWDNVLNRVADAVSKSPALQGAVSALSGALDGLVAKLDMSATAGGKVDTTVIVILKSFNSLLSGLNVVQGAFNAFQSGIAMAMQHIASSVVKALEPWRAAIGALAKLPTPMQREFTLAFGAIEAVTRTAAGAAIEYSRIQKEQEADYTRNANAIEAMQRNLGTLIGQLGSATTVTDVNATAVRNHAAAVDMAGKSIFDMGVKLGHVLDPLKILPKVYSISEAQFERSSKRIIDSLAPIPKAAEAGFFMVGKAASDAASKVDTVTKAVNGFSSSVSGFGQGMTISVPTRNVTQAQLAQMYRELGFIGAGTSGGAGFFHSGGVIGRLGRKRMHGGGLMDREVPIVAQEGEGVLSRTGMATLSMLNAGIVPGGGGGATTIIFNLPNAVLDTPASLDRLATRVERALVTRRTASGKRVFA